MLAVVSFIGFVVLIMSVIHILRYIDLHGICGRSVFVALVGVAMMAVPQVVR